MDNRRLLGSFIVEYSITVDKIVLGQVEGVKGPGRGVDGAHQRVNTGWFVLLLLLVPSQTRFCAFPEVAVSL